jgi:gamma-glutamyltranspeptidase/glutathione hydrolase
MDDFSLQPGIPNAFNLIGGEANAVAAGKRPLSSMCPTVVSKDGRPMLAVGAAGGPTIISQTLLAIVNSVDYHLDIAAALRSPRIHHQWRPDELRIETAVDASVREELVRRGHKLEPTRSFGATQAVGRDDSSFTGTADPRNEGTAAEW